MIASCLKLGFQRSWSADVTSGHKHLFPDSQRFSIVFCCCTSYSLSPSFKWPDSCKVDILSQFPVPPHTRLSVYRLARDRTLHASNRTNILTSEVHRHLDAMGHFLWNFIWMSPPPTYSRLSILILYCTSISIEIPWMPGVTTFSPCPSWRPMIPTENVL